MQTNMLVSSILINVMTFLFDQFRISKHVLTGDFKLGEVVN